MGHPLTNHPCIEILSIKLIREDAGDPRFLAKKNERHLDTFVARFGAKMPLLVDTANVAIGANAMVAALRRAKFTEVPVIRAHFFSEAERRAYVVALHRTAELGEWDDDKLHAELEFLFEDGFGLDGTGFDLSALDFSIKDEKGEERILLPSPAEQAITRIGDLWRIGPHRLYCGDSRDPASFEALLEGDFASIVFGDAPYNVPIQGHVSGNHQAREFAMASGEMSSAQFTGFLRAVFRNCVRFSTDGSIHYQCMDWRHLSEILDAAEGVYTEFKQLVVWAKPTGGQGAFLRSRHELVLVFKSGRARHVNNIGLKRYRTNVVEYPGASGFYKGRERDLADHVTCKPVALIADFLIDCSNRGDLVLDPFAGSSTTLLAAHKTKRRGAAIEIDPLYVDTGLRRLATATGLTPMHADGRSFDQVAADRASEDLDRG